LVPGPATGVGEVFINSMISFLRSKRFFSVAITGPLMHPCLQKSGIDQCVGCLAGYGFEKGMEIFYPIYFQEINVKTVIFQAGSFNHTSWKGIQLGCRNRFFIKIAFFTKGEVDSSLLKPHQQFLEGKNAVNRIGYVRSKKALFSLQRRVLKMIFAVSQFFLQQLALATMGETRGMRFPTSSGRYFSV
jgi:hypothetical protein